ncbi:hypothetical protein ACFOMD_02025 [Sphingoaurantiacus capsulatus]|uniref:Uncharacterized protein n=1 Tax=Sphingoaurantiacus capsulatus TaxID=1771310 RepID=A0ABV7X9L0_9SPHN
MNIIARALCATALLSATAATAQQPALAPAPASTATVLRSGTAVILRTSEELTTEGKMLKPGRRFNLELAEAVSVNGQVVIPAGARAIGEVTEVRNKGMWGKSGGINARLVSLNAGDRTIRIAGTIDDKGKTGTAGVVASVALIPLAGFFVTGTSARIPMGTTVAGFTDEDLPLAFAAAPAPMVVPAAAVPAVVAVAPTSSN